MYECTRCGHKKEALSSMADYDFRRWRTHGSAECPIEVLGREDICGVCRCLCFFAIVDDCELEPLHGQVSAGTLDADAIAVDQMKTDSETDTMDTRDEMIGEMATTQVIRSARRLDNWAIHCMDPHDHFCCSAAKTEPSSNLQQQTHCQLDTQVGRCLDSDSDTDSEDSDDVLGEKIVRCCRNFQLGTIKEVELPRGLTFADFRHVQFGPGPAPIDEIEIDDDDNDNRPETSSQAMRRNPGRFQLDASKGYMEAINLPSEAKEETTLKEHAISSQLQDVPDHSYKAEDDQEAATPGHESASASASGSTQGQN
ncbi:uncharacterized protein DMAD_01118 [Drosophila madeirensis]|uniref:Uncharacterized protein n=1 Tax=Drosophila madeirensis TaxID=30013 RepID=A0AAU9G0F3_DROMD